MGCRVQCSFCNSDCANLDGIKRRIVSSFFGEDQSIYPEMDIAICSHCGSYGELGKKCNRGEDCPEGMYL